MKSFPGSWAALAVLAAAAGCGGRGPSPADLSTRLPVLLDHEFPLHLRAGSKELVIAAPPRRVLPANAAWVDCLSLLVGPERVAALPTEAFGYSRLASGAPGWSALPELVGFEGERVLAFAPDLVLAHTWQDPQSVATLERAGVPVLVVPVPESWAEITATLELLAEILGEPARGRAVLAALEARRAALAARARRFAGWRALCYTNLGAGGWSSGARTTGDVLLGLAGLANATAAAGLVGDVPADQERLLALAPDVFVVGRPDRSESSTPSAEYLLAEPALARLAAVRAGRIVTLPAALFDSASPELLRGAELLLDELERRASVGAAPDGRPGGG